MEPLIGIVHERWEFFSIIVNSQHFSRTTFLISLRDQVAKADIIDLRTVSARMSWT